MKKIQMIPIINWKLQNGKPIDIVLSYQLFGPELGTAPVVLVNHALTGNSNVSGENGWWNDLIGENKTIDTNQVTVLAFNIPGNGFDDEFDHLTFNYKDFTAKDIALIFWNGLEVLKVNQLFAVIGGSLGGGIAWEMAALKPNAIQNLIPIASHWSATDWIIANVLVQDRILNNSDDPIADARLHAMLLYRTPQSLSLKFNRQKENETFQSENWLIHHGVKLQNRFRLASYKLMNHLLRTIAIAEPTNFLEKIPAIQSNIHLVAVDTDLFFIASETRQTYEGIKPIKANVFFHEIQSIHGHDAFLIEYQQLSEILSPIFQSLKTQKYATAN